MEIYTAYYLHTEIYQHMYNSAAFIEVNGAKATKGDLDSKPHWIVSMKP